MGMSASQARFLSLTARKNNVEFEGQQINQQRTTLSNESASYYSELCNMTVPTPPSIDDYTKVSYTFNDGAMTNTLTSLLPDTTTEGRANNRYVVNYVEEWQDDYAIVPAASSLVEKNGDTYSIGNSVLRKAGVGPDGTTASSSSSGTAGSGTTSGTGSTGGTPGTDEGSGEAGTNNYQYYIDVEEDGTTTRYEVFYDDDNNPYYNKGAGSLSSYEESMIKYYDISGGTPVLKYFVGNSNKIYAASDIEQKTPVTINESEYIIATEDESYNPSLVGVVDGKHHKLDDDGNPITSERVYITDLTQIQSVQSSSRAKSFSVPFDADDEGAIDNGDTAVGGSVSVTGSSVAFHNHDTDITKTNDEYWNSLSTDQRTALLQNEEYLLKMVQEKTGDDGDFYIRYIKNTTTGNYEPYLYAYSELSQSAKYNNKNLGSIPCYSLGSTTQTREILHKNATVEKDSSGRYVAITIELEPASNDKEAVTRTYNLTTTTTTDEEAYNDAMNQYNYAQHEYDHKIQEINSKLEIVQQQDKQLELKLKQLDTEENAISTEMDAVKKVISKNVESSFKTFNA